MSLEATHSKLETAPFDVIPVFSRFFGSWHFSVGRRGYALHELEGHYDKKSGVWQAKVDRLGFEDAYRSLIQKVLRQERYNLDASSPRVLDAGIGTGAMTAAFAQLVQCNFQLVGIDVSSEMLQRAKEKLAMQCIQPELLQADLGTIPYPDNTFDVVLVAHVLEHTIDPETAVAELYRVLKPGGLLIACVTRRSLAGAFIQFMWRTHQVNMKSALGWLRRSGFQTVRAVPLDRNSITRRFSIGYAGRKPDHKVH